jgi:hypothetical protein
VRRGLWPPKGADVDLPAQASLSKSSQPIDTDNEPTGGEDSRPQQRGEPKGPPTCDRSHGLAFALTGTEGESSTVYLYRPRTGGHDPACQGRSRICRNKVASQVRSYRKMLVTAVGSAEPVRTSVRAIRRRSDTLRNIAITNPQKKKLLMNLGLLNNIHNYNSNYSNYNLQYSLKIR